MKKELYKNLATLLFASALVFLNFGATYAQKAETFDIISFKTPKGWQKEVQQNGVQMGVENADGGICLITLFKSVPGGGDSKANFETAWEAIVKETVTVKTAVQMNDPADENGWTVESGLAQYENDGKKGVVMLLTATGNGKMVNVLALTNTDAYQKDITDFLESISLPKLKTEKIQNAPSQTTSNKDNEKLIGKWNRSGSVTPTYADPNNWGNSGYTKSRYEFLADGSYSFTERTFRMSFQNILIVKETGTYTVNNNQITISPQKSVIEAYTKRNNVDELGNLVKSQNRKLEKVTYQFTFHYFSGINEWNLVLQAGDPTNRDGQFSNNTTFQKAWYFDQKFIDNDLTSSKGK